MRLLARWLILALALLVTARFVPGIRIDGTNAWVAVAAMVAILGLVNAFVRPALRRIARPLIVLTLGLFLLVVNAGAFGIASWLAVNWLGVGFYIDGFWPALWGSILVGAIAFLLSLLLPDRAARARPARA